MNRTYNLRLDLQFKCNNSNMEFMQYDEGTSDFYLRITNHGSLVDIEKAIVVLAVIKPNNTVESQFVEVENGLVYADLKASMKDLVGNYQARALLILEGERVTTDVITYTVSEDNILFQLNESSSSEEEFTLLTDMLSRLSVVESQEQQRQINEADRILKENDREVEENKRVEAELVREHQDADREKAEAIRESSEHDRNVNEDTRVANEATRSLNENTRITSENARVQAEIDRINNYDFMTDDELRRRNEADAHKIAESNRVSAETDRVNFENQRRTVEQARVSNETTRENNETTRISNENTRLSNENDRVASETTRQNTFAILENEMTNVKNNFNSYTDVAKVDEDERKANEATRVSSEATRQNNEATRISSENTRNVNEAIRQNNESSRQNVFSTKVNEVNTKITETETTRQSIITTKNDLVAQFNALAPANSTNAEVQLARTSVNGTTYASLQERLLADNKQQNILYASVSGTYISTDSVDGYAKNVVIEGNTVQSATVLSDIRSTGTKLSDGRYEIPLLSCGENLFNGKLEVGGFDSVGQPSVKSCVRSNYIKINNDCTAKRYDNNLGVIICHYDKDYKYLGYTSWATGSRKSTDITTYPNTKYVRLEFSNTTDINIKVSLYNGVVDLPYVSYQEHKLTILSDVQIEKVGTADRIVQLNDGLWYKEKNNITIKLDGTRDWSIKKTFTDYTQFGFLIADALKENNSLKLISDYAIPTLAIYDQDVKGLYCHQGTLFLNYLKSKAPTLTDFKNSLNNEHILLKYPLATPIYIPLPDDQQVALRTFNNKTNILSLCEIEPTVKCDVPKSTQASINSINLHLDSVDSELEKIKKLEDATNSTVITDKDFVNIGDTGNGYLSDVKLDGRTLVNLLKYNFDLVLIPGVIKTDETTRWKLERGTAVSAKGYITFSNLKPNTKYTLKVTQVNSINDKFAIYDYIAGVFIVTYTSNSTITFTTKSNVTDTRLYIDNTIDITTYLYKTILLIEGEQLYQSNYFEGLKSVGQDVNKLVVASIGENLFNPYNTSKRTVNTVLKIDDNSVTVTDEYYAYNIIKVERNTDYYLSAIREGNAREISIFGATKDSLNASSLIKALGVLNGTFNSGSNNYIAIAMYSSGGTVNTCKFSNVMLSKGTVAKTYTLFETDKKEILYLDTVDSTWKKPVLKGIWSNGLLAIGDAIYKHADNKYYYHKIMNERVLNGSENYTLYKDKGTTICFYVVISDRKNTIHEVISDKFNYLYGGYDIDIENISLNNSDRVYISINKSKLVTQDAAGFKTYLASNNITFVYQSLTEQVYECTPIDVASYSTETNYTLECGVLSPRSTIKCQNYIGEIVNNMKEKISNLENIVYQTSLATFAIGLNVLNQ